MKRISNAGRSISSGRAAVLIVATVVFVMSIVVPAFGGPRALSAANAVSIAKKALKKANQADKRSKKALAEAQKVGSQSTPGKQGPPGPPGSAGAPGAPGSNAFGSLTYSGGAGGARADAGYVADFAPCLSGEAPTGGSVAAISGAETGGTNPGLGDAGNFAADVNPQDGFMDGWVAYAYNATGSAEILAGVVCAPAGRASVASALRTANSKRSQEVLKLLNLP